MMTEFALSWGTFGHSSGQVPQRNCPGILLYSQTSVVGIAKGGINQTYGLSKLILRNTNQPK